MKLNSIILLVMCSLSLSLFSKENEVVKVPAIDKAGKQVSKDVLFQSLLKENKELKAIFTHFESESQENAGGRYGGYEIKVIELQSSIVRERENQELGIYSETEIKDLALHIRFHEGMRMGSDTTKGFFVLVRSVVVEREKLSDDGDGKRLSIKGGITLTDVTEKIDLAKLKPLVEE